MSAVMGLSEEAMLQLILYRLSMSYIVSTVNSVCVGCCERREQRYELFTAIVTLSVCCSLAELASLRVPPLDLPVASASAALYGAGSV
jgi:hypothetical protein